MMRNSVVRRRKSAGSRRVRAASQAVAVMDILERRTLFTALAVWNFNDAAASTSTSALLTVDRVTPGITAGMTTTLTGSAFTVFTTGTQVNADSGDANGSAMGIVGTASNNGSITFTTTTTGYNGVSVSFASQRTTTGANSDQFQYSTDGTTFTNFGAVYTPPAAYAVQSFDLSSVSGLNNNPNAAFRIIFNGASSTSGNNRIDNLIVAGTALPIPTQPLAFNAPSTSVPESAGTVTLTVTRGPANNTDLSGDETVTYSTANGTATAGTNYNATTGTVVFHSGDTSKTITVPVLDAPNMGGNKTFTVTLSNPTLANGSSGVTATLGPQSTTTVTILDTTETFALTSSAFTASDVLNPSAGTPGAAIVSISRSGYTGDAATVNYATVNGSAIAGTDYTATSGTLNFAANQSVGYFSVPVNDLTTTKAFGVT